MIVVDSSVWIDHFNAVESDEASLLRDLIRSDADVGIVDLCLSEILQGFRRERDVDLVSATLLVFPVLAPQSTHDHLYAAELYRTARRRGHTIRSTIDCLIAAVCVREGSTLLHRDRDYDRIASCSSLRILAA